MLAEVWISRSIIATGGRTLVVEFCECGTRLTHPALGDLTAVFRQKMLSPNLLYHS